MDEVDVLVALARQAQLERTLEVLVDRCGEALDLLLGELRRESERRQPRAVEDLVRVRAADPGERALVAEQGCRRRLSATRISRSRSAPSPSASGPRCASSASVCEGVSSQTPARFFLPASVSTS